MHESGLWALVLIWKKSADTTRLYAGGCSVFTYLVRYSLPRAAEQRAGGDGCALVGLKSKNRGIKPVGIEASPKSKAPSIFLLFPDLNFDLNLLFLPDNFEG